MNRPTYIFAGGGTGGHLYPALAVAAELLQIRTDARIVFACSNRPIDSRVLSGTPHAFVSQPVRPLPRRLGDVAGFVLAWWKSKAIARDMIRDLQPIAVLGAGGFAAGPAVTVAASRGVPAALLNPDAVPGIANRHLAGKVRAVFTQFESTGERFPVRLRSRIRCVGCPVRSELLAGDRQDAVKFFDLLPDRKTLLVLGGSTGAASINEAVAAMADKLASLADGWQLLHIAGPGAARLAQAADAPGNMHMRVLDYCDRMDLAYAAADLALCRGGASTVAELAATATPAAIMPYPHHRDQQQKHNAEAMVASGAGLCLPDARDPAANAAALSDALLPIMSDPPRLEGMRSAAEGLAKPDAAAQIAEWLAGV